MTKTISFKLSKRLNELGLLDNIETEYIFQEGIKSERGEGGTISFYGDGIFKIKGINEFDLGLYKFYKTLTLEEAIEFIGKQMCQLELLYPNGGVWNLQVALGGPNFKGTIFECYEQFLEYLLDNNLLGQK